MNRLVALIADALDAAEERGLPSWQSGGFAIGLLLLLVGGSATLVTVWLVASDPDGITTVSDPASGEPSPAASADAGPAGATPGPTGGVAASTRLVTDFDMLPTGSPIDGWTLSADGRLETAAQPTAVDRSARLEGEGGATACQDLDVELALLEANFMIDSLAEGDVTLLALAMDGGSTYRLQLADGSASLFDSAHHIELEPGAWYRWMIRSANEGEELRLLAADGTLLAEERRPEGANARATEFCMTAPPHTRLYLSELTVEMR